MGYGRELYFWSFIVSLLLFALGAGVSVYQGVLRVRTPEPIENAVVNYVVLALSFVFEGVSWHVALRAFRATKSDLSYWQAIRRNKDPPAFMVVLEDTAALVGIVIATLGTYAADTLQRPALDGVASISIGVVLGLTASLLARESKGLLIGERADPKIARQILAMAADEPGVTGTNGIFTVQLAPDQIVVALSLEFVDELRTPQIEACVTRIEQRIREQYPQVVALFVKPQSHGGFDRGNIQFGQDVPDGAPDPPPHASTGPDPRSAQS